MATVRQQLFANLATPYVDAPLLAVELYMVELSEESATRFNLLVWLVAVGFSFGALLLLGGTIRPFFLVPVVALIALGVLRARRALKGSPNDVLVAVTASQVAVLRASSGLFRGWRVLNPVGIWLRKDMKAAITGEFFELRLETPSGEELRLHPSPFTEDSKRLATLLCAPR